MCELSWQIERLEARLEDLVAEEGVSDAHVRIEPLSASAERQESTGQPLPEHLPREGHVLNPFEQECPACGGHLKPLGEDASSSSTSTTRFSKLSGLFAARRRVEAAIASSKRRRRAATTSAAQPLQAC